MMGLICKNCGCSLYPMGEKVIHWHPAKLGAKISIKCLCGCENPERGEKHGAKNQGTPIEIKG